MKQYGEYERVGMFRIDVSYVTPIDIFKAGNEHDTENRVAVIPAFAKFPVNDRTCFKITTSISCVLFQN